MASITASGSGEIKKRVFIEFEASGIGEIKKAGDDVEKKLDDVGKAAGKAAGGKDGKGGVTGLFNQLRGAGEGMMKVVGFAGQLGLAIQGLTTAIQVASNAGRYYTDTLNAVDDAMYGLRKSMGLTGTAFVGFAGEVEREAQRAIRVMAPLLALGEASRDQSQRATLAALLRSQGAGGAILAGASGLSAFSGRPAAAPARRGGGGGGGGGGDVDPMAAIAGISFGGTFDRFGAEAKASGDAYINGAFGRGADKTIAARAAEVEAAVGTTEAAFASAALEASRFAEVQALALDAEQTAVWADVTTGALDTVGKSMASAVVQSVLLGQGLKQMARSALAGLTVQAATEALFQTAKGFALLAVGRPDAAALAFTSAKAFAGVGAIAGVGAASLGGFGGGGGGGGRAALSGSGVGDTGRSPSQSPQTQVVVNVGISQGRLHDAVFDEARGRETRRGVPRVQVAS